MAHSATELGLQQHSVGDSYPYSVYVTGRDVVVYKYRPADKLAVFAYDDKQTFWTALCDAHAYARMLKDADSVGSYLAAMRS